MTPSLSSLTFVGRKVKTIKKVKIIIKVKNDHRSKFSNLSN